MPATLSATSAEVRAEVYALKQRLADTEEKATRERQTHADVEAGAIRAELDRKRAELLQAEKLEAESAEAERHAQALQSLDELTIEEARAKSDILRFQKELSFLPGKIQLAQARHSELLRQKALLKKSLGMIA